MIKQLQICKLICSYNKTYEVIINKMINSRRDSASFKNLRKCCREVLDSEVMTNTL